jgi:beta propeller repeat protein
MRLMLSLLLVVSIIVFGPVIAADTIITQVTNNSHEDNFPSIEGNYVVWQAHIDGDWEIFLYDIATGITTQITNNDYDDILPKTDGNYVVWLGLGQSGGEIFLYDISTGETTQINNDSHVDCAPQIANGRVVWTSHQVTETVEPGEIFLYDIVAEATTALSSSVDPDGTLDDSLPQINDESAIWVQADDAGNTTLFIHYFGTGGTEPAPEAYVWPDSPQIDGGLTVVTRHDGSDREILAHNTSRRTYTQITDNELEDSYPCISGNYIAWMGGEGEASEIYLTFYEDEDNGTGGTTVAGGSSGVAIDGDGSCFVATAAFSSYMDPHVQVIRDFRDEYLLTNIPGRWFVGMYNTYGPFWADLLNAHPFCKPIVRLALMPVVGTSYFLVKTSLGIKLLAGFLLVGFIVTCLLRIHCRSVTRSAKK